jgi:hypothetical protein
MQRLTPGPFGGFFDDVTYDSPAFAPVVITCALLVFVWVAMTWALRRRRGAGRPRVARGFAVLPSDAAAPSPGAEYVASRGRR